MRTTPTAVLAVAAALLSASGAAAGGFATVGLDPLPDGSQAWHAQLTILQHGRTPLDGLRPKLIVERGSVRRVFVAKPAGQPGVYSVEVAFPSGGTWSYVVDDGFTMTHSFPPVRVGGGESAPSADEGPDMRLALAVAAVAGLAAALGSAWLLRTRRRPAPAGG
ncbi:MAG: hypothetical protein QOE60_1437 [Thermoleophilaceae bacterium]|nr:hypothetical protein [Thermoleophilaceae bacterium]